MFYKISREPLVHFLLAGFLLFVYFKSCGSDTSSEDTIVVNKSKLLDFMQYQSKAFNAEVFEKKLAQFSNIEKQQLIDNYTRDEVLYREAVRLGMDQNDFVIKRRVIQKMYYILDDLDEADLIVSEDSLQAFFERNQHRYYQADRYSFTHIFFKNGGDVLARVNAFIQNPNHQKLSASTSLPYGARFLYHRTYMEKTGSF